MVIMMTWCTVQCTSKYIIIVIDIVAISVWLKGEQQKQKMKPTLSITLATTHK